MCKFEYCILTILTQMGTAVTGTVVLGIIYEVKKNTLYVDNIRSIVI